MTVIRTQIQLTEKQARALRARAKSEGISLAEMIRRCVDKGLADGKPSRAELYARAVRAFGRFSDREGATDVGENHDKYLDEAFDDRRDLR